jgi:hypothetical protein
MLAPPTTKPSSGVVDTLIQIANGPQARTTFASPVTIDDGQWTMWLQPADSGMQLTVIDRSSGGQLFKGPIGTDEQWKQVPEDIRAKFDAWRSLTGHAPEAPKK